MKRLLQTVCFIIMGGASLEENRVKASDDVEMYAWDINKKVPSETSVSACVHDTESVLIFQKVEKGHWYYGGHFDTHIRGARKIAEYCVYPYGHPHRPNKHPGQLVVPTGETHYDKSLLEAVRREFFEETGCDIPKEERVAVSGKCFDNGDRVRKGRRYGSAYVLFVKMPTGSLQTLVDEITDKLARKKMIIDKLDAGDLSALAAFEPPVKDDELAYVSKLSFSEALNKIKKKTSKVCDRSRLIVGFLKKEYASSAAAAVCEGMGASDSDVGITVEEGASAFASSAAVAAASSSSV